MKKHLVPAFKRIIAFFISLTALYITPANAQWVQTSGPYTNATVFSLATDGTNLYAGTQRSGIYLSTDFGSTWTLRSSGLGYFPVHTILINGTVLLAATEDGLYTSSDNGNNWTFRLSGGFYSTSSVVLKSTTSTLISASNGGIYRSVNGGSSWTNVNGTLLNATLEVVGNNFIAATNSGVYLSTDDGLTWTLVNNAMTSIQALKVNGSSIYAGTSSNGVYVSADNGSTWTAKNTGLSSLNITSFVFNGTDLYAGCSAGVYKTANAGTSWSAVNTGITATTVYAMALNGAQLFIGTLNTGVYQSANFGASWTQSNTGMVTSDVRAMGFNGSNLFAGTNGSGAYLTGSNGANWNGINTGLSNQYVNDFASTGVYTFAATSGGGVFVTTNNGASWTQVNSGLTNTTVNALAISGTSIFAGTTGGVFLSTNYGTSWTAVNTGLSSNSVQSLTISGSYIFAGTSDQGAFRSPVSSPTWTSVNTGLPVSGMYAFYSLVSIGSNVFAAIGGSSSSGVFVTSNNGASWTNTNAPIGAYDLGVSGTNLFAMAYGAYISTDNGATWSNLSTGLPSMAHYGFAASGNYVFVGSVGLGVWRRKLDEILCSINPPVMSSASSATICSGGTVNIPLTNTGVAATYTWLASDNSQTTGESTSSQSASTLSNTLVNNSSISATTVTYTVTPTGTSGNCTGTPQTVTVTVNPKPVMTSNATVSSCSGQTVGLSLSSSTSSTYTWQAANNANTTGESTSLQSASAISDIIINTSLVPQIVNYTVTPVSNTGSCTGTPQTVAVTVNPTPILNSTSLAAICSGGTVNVNLSSSVPSTYVWIAGDNTNTTGESTTYQSTSTLNNAILNNTSAPQQLTYTITATAVVGACAGAQTFTLTVNPAPAMTSAATASICSGQTLHQALSANISSTFTWVANDNPNTSNESLSLQSGDTINNTIQNNSSLVQVVYYNVTPVSAAASCAGTSQSVAVTVKPAPVMSSASSATVCSGGTLNIPLSSSIGSSYTWFATDNANISGESTSTQTTPVISNILTNNSAYVQQVLYTVTPVSLSGSCTGNSQNITVSVNPPDNAGFTYLSSSYCKSGTNPAAIISGVSGGSFTAGSGLVFANIYTGLINLSASAVGSYTVTYTTNSTCPNTATYNLSITAPVSPIFSYTGSPYCSNGMNPLPGFGAGAGAGTFSANPSGLAFNSTLTGEINLSASAPGTYTVTNTIAAANGCASDYATALISINPLPTVNFSGLAASYFYNDATVTLSGSPAGGTFSGTAISANTFNPAQAGIGNFTITYTYTNANGCTNAASHATTIAGQPAPPAICEVTVDVAGKYNEIYWDKTLYSRVDSFIVYRETGAGYQRIGAVSDTALSMFIDTVRVKYFPNTGDPNAGTYRYKLQLRDSLGNYSPMSPYHNTIYFNKNFGTFTWTPYQIEGQSVPLPSNVLITYDLWRDDQSNGNWHQVNSVTGSQLTQTDIGWNAALDTTASWRVLTNWTIGCTPTRGAINTSRSNIKTARLANGIHELRDVMLDFKLYPNPAGNYVIVEVPEMLLKGASVKIVNLLGERIYQSELKSLVTNIDISMLGKGMYIISIENKTSGAVKRLVVN